MKIVGYPQDEGFVDHTENRPVVFEPGSFLGAPVCQDPQWSPFAGRHVSCRRCNYCLGRKTAKWFMRGCTEVTLWPRTWFITLTFKQVPPDPYVEVQLWLKRFRKQCGNSPFRYLCIQEFGALNNRLHYHLLLHCPDVITRRNVESKWNGGFSKAVLVKRLRDTDMNSQQRKSVIYYVVKYLMKDPKSRVRASQKYGKGFEDSYKPKDDSPTPF